MVELNKEEKNRILELSKEFIKIHGEILSVEESIKKLEERSADLISELQECRAKEKEFSDDLKEKYGPGCLDPSGLCWKNEEVLTYEEIK
jgi:chromosome segregation ATPase